MELKNIIKKRKIGYYWVFIFFKIIFLALTPVFFKIMNFAFIFHSFFWGVVTFTILWWGLWIIIALFFGRIGCGWICPFGTIFDFTNPVALFDIRQKKPLWLLRIFMVIVFFQFMYNFLFY